MRPETTTNHKIRALIHQLIRSHLDWMGDVSVPGLKTTHDDIMLSATYCDTSYIIVKSDAITLYRVAKNAVPMPIASTLSSECAAELTGLFNVALKAYNDWITALFNMSEREKFGDVVTVRDLIRAIDDPNRLASDAADEATYQALNRNAITCEAEILAFRRRAYERARKIIFAVLRSTDTESHFLYVDDSNPSPLAWRVTIVSSLGSAQTDVHIRVCPDFHTDDEDGDMIRETAVNISALIIVLSALEQNF